MLTPDERIVLRRRIDFRRQMGNERVSVTLPELTALLDAADEADRLAGVEDRLSVLLWRLTNGRLSKTDYPVEFMEQEIEENLTTHHELNLRDELDRMAEQVERVRALHVCDWGCGNPSHTNPDVGCPDCFIGCDACGEPHPCPTRRALDGGDDE